MTMSICDIFVAVESSKLDSDDTTSMDSTELGRVVINDSDKNSSCQKVKNVAYFIRV